MTDLYRSIAIIGDSQAEGLSGPLRAALVRAGVGPVLGAVTISGITTRGLLDREKPQALMAHTDAELVIVALGGNDSTTSSYPATLAAFVDAFRRTDGSRPDIVWIGPAFSLREDVDARHEMVSAVQSQVLPGLGVRWYDSREWTQDGHAGDDVHFTREAYAQQAQEVVARVLDRGLGAGVVVGVVIASAIVLGGGLAAFAISRR